MARCSLARLTGGVVNSWFALVQHCKRTVVYIDTTDLRTYLLDSYKRLYAISKTL
jgi:hypothetical protein